MRVLGSRCGCCTPSQSKCPSGRRTGDHVAGEEVRQDTDVDPARCVRAAALVRRERDAGRIPSDQKPVRRRDVERLHPSSLRGRLDPLPLSEVEQQNNPNECGPQSPSFELELPKSCSGSENASFANEYGSCSAVPFQRGEQGQYGNGQRSKPAPIEQGLPGCGRAPHGRELPQQRRALAQPRERSAPRRTWLRLLRQKDEAMVAAAS